MSRGDVRSGGYEPEIHACEGHLWLPEDRTPPGGGAKDLRRRGWYEMYVCKYCRAVQCDRYESQPRERCQEHRHHTGFHRFPSGKQVRVGA